MKYLLIFLFVGCAEHSHIIFKSNVTRDTCKNNSGVDYIMMYPEHLGSKFDYHCNDGATFREKREE